MDGITYEIPLFLFATFAGAFVAGLSGFAFGLVAASLWLYIVTPVQSATLIVAFGLLVQGYSVWKLRGALDWPKLWPFIAGGRHALDMVRSAQRSHRRRNHLDPL